MPLSLLLGEAQRRSPASVGRLDGWQTGGRLAWPAMICPTGQRLDTLPGVETVVGSELLVGIGECGPVCDAGIAPKEWSSEGEGARTRLEHGQRSLRSTFYHIALIHVCIKKNGTVRCQQSREPKLWEGTRKKAAMICLVRIVWRMMKYAELYWKLLAKEAAY